MCPLGALLRGLFLAQIQPEREHPRHRLVDVFDAVLKREDIV